MMSIGLCALISIDFVGTSVLSVWHHLVEESKNTQDNLTLLIYILPVNVELFITFFIIFDKV